MAQRLYLNEEEQQHMKRMMLDGRHRSWKQISASFKYKFNKTIPIEQCRRLWKRIMKYSLGKPNEDHMNMVIKLFEEHGSQYVFISRKMTLTQSPFIYAGYIRVFLKKFIIKMIKRLQLQVYKRFRVKIEKISNEKLNRISHLLTQSPSLCRGLRKPNQLRQFLLKFYFMKKSQSLIDSTQLKNAYKKLIKIDKQMISQRKYDQYKQWSFKWTKQETLRLYQLYRAFGTNISEISKSMTDQFQEKQTYTYTIIRGKIIKMLRNGINKLVEIIKETQMESELDINIYAKKYIANKFIWSKNDKDFNKTVQIIEIGLGFQLDKNQIMEVFLFFKKFFGQKRQFIVSSKRRRQEEQYQECLKQNNLQSIKESQ